ncbi:MAG: glucose-6-phosphate isomerase [Clostridiales Family XIII bacterium]|jgi:glucose-6-phosphate isomerase|nr:glucose-6-phosphate isomerase [Clostridiales Family XIII bacterium]
MNNFDNLDNRNKRIEIVYETGEDVLSEAETLEAAAAEKVAALYRRDMPFTGWVDWANRFPEDALEDILKTADEIAARCKYFVVIGIGGSYLGAKAALSFIDRADSVRADGRPEVVFAGFNLSGTYHANLIDKIKDEDICLLIISKSGGTLEPSVAFLTLKKLLTEKYGHAEALSRIYAVTDAESGKLRTEAQANGYKAFVLPSDIGGRFSVLTPVGLLPLAAAGVDVRAILAGARSAGADDILASAKRLACVRTALEKQKSVETFCFFDPSVEDFTAWLLQLFGESEGKGGRGVLPVGVGVSRDLHSLGQFFQDGKQIFYETLLFVTEPTRDVKIGGEDAGDYAGRAYSEFNRAVLEGMAKAHRAVSVPIIRVYIPDNSAYSFGQLVYFFELTCAATGLLMGVNPFDQPGVEAYKKGMLDYLAGQ